MSRRFIFLSLCLLLCFHVGQSIKGGNQVYSQLLDNRPVVYITVFYPYFVRSSCGCLIHRSFVLTCAQALPNKHRHTVVRIGSIRALEGGIHRLAKRWFPIKGSERTIDTVSYFLVQLDTPYDAQFDLAFLSIPTYRPHIGVFTVSGFHGNEYGYFTHNYIGHQLSTMPVKTYGTHACLDNYDIEDIHNYKNFSACFTSISCGSAECTQSTFPDDLDSGTGVFKRNSNIMVAIVSSYLSGMNPKHKAMSVFALRTDVVRSKIMEQIGAADHDEFEGYPEWPKDLEFYE